MPQLNLPPSNSTPVPSTPEPSPAPDAAKLADLDELIRNAAQGDRLAITAIAVGLAPTLLATVRRIVRHGEDAEDLLQDFFVALAERRAAHFPPKPGHGLAWMEGLLRSMARKRREVRAAEWGMDPDEFSRRRPSRRALRPKRS